MSKKRIHQVVRQNQYEFSMHALEEMDDDELLETDIHHVLLHGDIVAKLTEDERGMRLVIRGISVGKEIEVVCRFLSSGWLRIITTYIVDR